MFFVFIIFTLYLFVMVLEHFYRKREFETRDYLREFMIAERELLDASMYNCVSSQLYNNTCDFVSKYCPVDISEITQPTKEEDFFNAFLWS